MVKQPAGREISRAEHPWGLVLDGDIQDPATDAEVARTQRVLGVELPAEYIAALRVRNGGQLRHTCFKLPPAAAKVFRSTRYAISRLAGVHPTHPEGLTQLAALARDEWNLPAGFVPLTGDGHSWCCLDYRGKDRPSVTHVDIEAGREFTVAASFGELLDGLCTDVDYLTPALFALDEGAPRGTPLSHLLLSVGCTEYGYPGVKPSPAHPLPPTWHWAAYRGLLRNSPVWIKAESNRLYAVSPVKTPKRPPDHPMLTVAVHPKDEAACLRRLQDVLGTAAVLIHGVQ
jgi:hypothetical protein